MARRNDHTREQIKELALNAAESIIDEDSINGLTARRIAAKMQYTVGTLYLVFENLDDLVVHINARTLDALKMHLQNSVMQIHSPRVRLANLLHAYVDFAHQQRQRWISVYTYRTEDENTLPDWYFDKITSLFSLIEKQLAGINVEEKLFQNSSTIKIQSRALWSSIHGVCVLSASGTLDVIGVSSVDDIVNYIISSFVGIEKSSEGRAA